MCYKCVWWHHWKLPLLFTRNRIRKARLGQGFRHTPWPQKVGTRRPSQRSEPRRRVEDRVGRAHHCEVQWEKDEEKGRHEPTDRKTSEAVMNYSCTINAYEATWKPFTVERSGYNTFYGSPHCKYPLFSRFEITAKHLPNTNLRGLADHKRTELTKRHIHIPPSCTQGSDNYLHFGT